MGCRVGISTLKANIYASRFLVVADDLVSSNDCGLQFRKQGLSAITILDKDCLDDTSIYETTVIDSETREIILFIHICKIKILSTFHLTLPR